MFFRVGDCPCQKPKHPHHHTRDAHPGNRHLEQRAEFERLVLKSLAVLMEGHWRTHYDLLADIKHYEEDHLK
jgi:uncharacterized protein Yka (UPF0111/DUF47 family)